MPPDLVQQGPGGHEIRRIETFREPAADRRQQVTRRTMISCGTQKLCKIGRAPQLPELGVLLLRKTQAETEQGDRLVSVVRAVSTQPCDLRLTPSRTGHADDFSRPLEQ